MGLALAFAHALAGCGGCGGGGDNNPDGAPPDGSFTITAIFPAGASRLVDSPLTITGDGISGTPAIQISNCDQPGTTYDLAAGAVTATSIATSLPADPARVQGAYTVTVTNGDGAMASLMCALHVVASTPPTVTLVVPSTAWQGSTVDAVSSDSTISIQGTGFNSTPNVRWVLRSDPAIHFDALFVGFISDGHLTAIVPSETSRMPAGSYDVFVINPDQLSAQWKTGAVAGTFTITGSAPPKVTDVTPARIQNGSCTSTMMTIAGNNFGVGATAWYVAPLGSNCIGSTTDANGNLLCPIAIDATTSTAITAHFSGCPALGPYPVVVSNPDAQSSYWYSIEVTPSSDGHLNVGAFETTQNRLETARWKHAVQFGFDAFSDAMVYVAGGQGTAGTVLGSVEFSRFDVFGVPGPFRHLEQFGGAGQPRIANDLTVPRAGLTLVRTGGSLFAIGGTTARSDTTTVVAASSAVERAEILGIGQMPGISKPQALPQTEGLPLGSWYYRVSAVGPWGESLATRDVVAIGVSGQIRVCWQAPSVGGATSYNIYRSLGSNGRAGTAAAIAYGVSASDNCWTDPGTEAQAPAPGNARGTLTAGGTVAAGTYSYRISAVVPLAGGGERETYASYASTTTIAAADVSAGNQTINVAWDALPIVGATYRVYRLDPLSGSYKLLDGADLLSTTSFVDTGVAFAASGATPVAEVRPLPPGSLSRWSASVPQLGAAREGLDGVVVRMDPALSGGLAARILVAGGRDGTGGSYAYRTTVESLGVYADGTTDPAWVNETPVFTHARAYYALLTTQDRNVTPFPPPPDQPPCGDCGVIERTLSGLVAPADAVAGGEPVYVIAALGDDAYAASSNTGRNDFESCAVDMATGHLMADCGVTSGTTWIVQNNDAPQGTFAHDAVLYFSYLYPFYAVQRETLGAAGTTLQIIGAAIARFPVIGDLAAAAAGQVLESFQSASTSFVVDRAYYQLTRLLAFVYVIGGYAEAHTEGSTAVPAGPTALVERHQQ
jgi:hypothetical protein